MADRGGPPPPAPPAPSAGADRGGGIGDRLGCVCRTARRPRFIWRRAQLALSAIAGHTFALDSPTWSGLQHDGLRTHFSGFLRHAGITSRLGVIPDRGDHWSGAGAPSPLVVLAVVEPDHRTAQIWTNVDLMAGWG